MKKYLAAALAVLLACPATARAQEYYYPQQNFSSDGNVAQVAPQAGGYMQPAETYGGPNNYRIYPGREYYGDNFGPIPRHPGDYRDALDRGSWSGRGGNTGSSNFSPY